MGCVPIVTNVAGTKEDIQEGINGYAVSVGDYKTMARIINELDESRYKIPLLGIKSYEVAREKCQMHDHISLWKGLLKEYRLM